MNSLLRRTMFLVAALVVLAGPARPETPAPAAVLTSCKGPVTIIHAGVSSPASFGLPLSDGDEVKTGAGAEAEIMFSAGNWVQIGANSSMKIKGHPAEKAEAAADARTKSGNFEVVQNFLKLKSAEGSSSIGVLRSGDKPPVLEPIAPSQTRIRAALPVFRWKAEDPASELKLTVYGERQVLWQTDVQGVDTFTYPATAPPLKPGVSYSWTLETADPLVSPPARTPAVYFELMAPTDARTLETDLSALDANRPGPMTYHLTRASIFFDHGLVDDAITETESAVAGDPGNDSLHAILGRLYAEAGRSREAIDEMNKTQK
jgi:hypothetical protein